MAYGELGRFVSQELEGKLSEKMCELLLTLCNGGVYASPLGFAG